MVNGLIMATEPLLAVLMLGRLGFAPWQYGLAFAVPCAGGLLGSRLSAPARGRFGEHRVLLRRRDAARRLGARAGLHRARARPGSSWSSWSSSG